MCDAASLEFGLKNKDVKTGRIGTFKTTEHGGRALETSSGNQKGVFQCQCICVDMFSFVKVDLIAAVGAVR